MAVRAAIFSSPSCVCASAAVAGTGAEDDDGGGVAPELLLVAQYPKRAIPRIATTSRDRWVTLSRKPRAAKIFSSHLRVRAA
jgi:hypothetical protein